MSLRLGNSNYLKRKIKTKKKFYDTLTKRNFTLNYYSELQNEINKLTNYSELKRQKTIEFLFFKFRNFSLKYVTKILGLKFCETYFICLDNINTKVPTMLQVIRSRQTSLEMYQKKLLNSGIKLILLNVEFLFSKNFLYKSLSVITLQSFYYTGLINYFLKELKMPTFRFIEFIKQVTGKINFFSNNKQNLFLLRSQNQEYLFNFENNFSLMFINFLFQELNLLYSNFLFLKNDLVSFIKFEFNSFLILTESLSNFESLFLQMTINRQFNLLLPVSKCVNKQIVEIYFFNKLFQLDFFLLKNLKTIHLKHYFKLVFVSSNHLAIKHNFVNFFFINKKSKKNYTLTSLKFYYLYNLTRSKTNLLFLEFCFDYSTRLIYLEKTQSELLILVNKNLKVFKSLNVIKNTQMWFFSLSNLVNFECDIYFYYLTGESCSNSLQFNQFEVEKNSNKNLINYKSNKLIFMYRNYLVIPLNFKKLIKLPLKSKEERYLISLKNLFNYYSNKNQNLLIRNLTEKLYVWVYFYRFLLIKHYFSQLDHKLFKLLWKWSIRRHNNKSKTWIKTKYFFQLNKKHLIFGSYMNQSKSFKKLFQSLSFIYLPFHLQLFLYFKFY